MDRCLLSPCCNYHARWVDIKLKSKFDSILVILIENIYFRIVFEMWRDENRCRWVICHDADYLLINLYTRERLSRGCYRFIRVSWCGILCALFITRRTLCVYFFRIFFFRVELEIGMINIFKTLCFLNGDLYLSEIILNRRETFREKLFNASALGIIYLSRNSIPILSKEVKIWKNFDFETRAIILRPISKIISSRLNYR